MARRYSTRSRRADGSATAEPAVGGVTTTRTAPAAHASDFAHGEFRAHLEALREACAEPGRIVLVTGPAGAGKSVVCEALLAELDPRTCAVNVSARQSDAYQRVLTAIVEAYGFEVEPGTGPQVMAELIAHHAIDLDAPSRRCVVVVDDAHELPLRDLHALLVLVDGSALTLVLAGAASLVAAVERIEAQFPIDWLEIQLAGLSVDQVNAYLQWRAGASDRNAPLTGTQAKELARRSRGLPGRLEQLVARLQSAGGANGQARGPFGFPTRHLIVLAALGLLLVGVYVVGWIAEDLTTSATSTQRVETIAMPPLPTQPDATGDSAEQRAEQQGAQQAAQPLASSQADTTESPAPAVTVPVAPRPIISRPASNGSATATPQTAPKQVADATGAAAAKEVATPASAPGPAVGTQSTGQLPAAAATAPASATPSPALGGTRRGADWIRAQPAGSYTLQLVSLSSVERAQAYIAQQPDSDSFATYRLMRNGQLFHVVVYGAFATKAAADAAAARLPRTAGNVQPWVRPFGQVQESLRTTPQ